MKENQKKIYFIYIKYLNDAFQKVKLKSPIAFIQCINIRLFLLISFFNFIRTKWLRQLKKKHYYGSLSL